jgi:hypothetical protein
MVEQFVFLKSLGAGNSCDEPSGARNFLPLTGFALAKKTRGT